MALAEAERLRDMVMSAQAKKLLSGSLCVGLPRQPWHEVFIGVAEAPAFEFRGDFEESMTEGLQGSARGCRRAW